jgi:hypothetical protein
VTDSVLVVVLLEMVQEDGHPKKVKREEEEPRTRGSFLFALHLGGRVRDWAKPGGRGEERA